MNVTPLGSESSVTPAADKAIGGARPQFVAAVADPDRCLDCGECIEQCSSEAITTRLEPSPATVEDVRRGAPVSLN
ncbi:MAG: 4Fe-4S binding protein [Chloroflexi bacterium]|nr:4Fe-4S binding protein [Chloroflexota bacterium]